MPTHSPLGRLALMFRSTQTAGYLYSRSKQGYSFFTANKRSIFNSAFAQNSPHPAVLLVESPAKAKKIQEYLGPDYRVLASYGHIRDLPAKNGSVNPQEGFEMRWELSDNARPRVAEIVEAVRGAPKVILATDPDREGEAISWHLVEELKERGVLSSNISPERITFTEVTKRAVEAALAAPREVSIPLVEAYMARRALDYLFGFNLSPLLWRKLPGARSAGRVQSVALRVVADREAAIEAFLPQKYWMIHAQVEVNTAQNNNNELGVVQASLTKIDGAAPPSPGFLNQELAERIQQRIDTSNFMVSAVTTKEIAKNPPPPFITSTLQQEASRRLGWGAARTMQVAQKLYEGGLITYMRTDGVSLAPHAVHALRSAVAEAHGDGYLPAQPRFYASKSKNAQEAHEAIRPTDPNTQPNALFKMGMESAEVQLYSLVRSRAMASQMASTKIQSVSADFTSEDGSITMRATASHTLFPGYLAVYGVGYNGVSGGRGAMSFEEREETSDEREITGLAARKKGLLSGEVAAEALARLVQGQNAILRDPEASEHETRPPGRFTEGTLVKALEEAGVGRPSTYAPIIKLLQTRSYVRKEGRALHAEPLGRVLSAFLCRYFPTYVDPEFTSRLENDLDEVSAGTEGWKDVLGQFWEPFHGRVAELGSLTGTEVIDMLNEELELLLFGPNKPQDGTQIIDSTTITQELEEESVVVSGTIGSTAATSNSTTVETANMPPGRICPSCSNPLSLKLSHRGGVFIGCSSYPECSYSRPVISQDISHDRDSDESSSASSSRLPTEIGVELADKYSMRGPVRILGEDSNGKVIFVRTGPYGSYVQLGLDSDGAMRRAPLPKDLLPRRVKFEYAISLLALPRELGDHPETGVPVIVRNGKFGPYVISGNNVRSIPKEFDPLKVTLEQGLELLKHSRITAERKKKGGITVKVSRNESAERRGRPRKLSALASEKAALEKIGSDGKPIEKKRGRPRKNPVPAEDGSETTSAVVSLVEEEEENEFKRPRPAFVHYIVGED